MLSIFENLFKVSNPVERELSDYLERHSAKYFSQGTSLLSEVSEELQLEAQAKLRGFFDDVLAAENPRQELRKLLVTIMQQYSEYQVSCLTEVEKKATFYPTCPYISGKLFQKIALFKDTLELLEQFGQNASTDQLVDMANRAALTNLYFLNALNVLRAYVDDGATKPDWFRPLLVACMVSAEYRVREALGEELSIDELLRWAAMDILPNIVKSGRDEPFRHWQAELADASDHITDLGVSFE